MKDIMMKIVGAILVITSIIGIAVAFYLFIQTSLLTSELELYGIFVILILVFLVGIRLLLINRLIFPLSHFKT